MWGGGGGGRGVCALAAISSAPFFLNFWIRPWVLSVDPEMGRQQNVGDEINDSGNPYPNNSWLFV